MGNEVEQSKEYKRNYFLTEYLVYNDSDGGHLAIVTNVKVGKDETHTYDVFVYDYGKVVKEVSLFDETIHDTQVFSLTTID